MHVYPPWEEKAAQYVKEARDTDFEENGIPEVGKLIFYLRLMMNTASMFSQTKLLT